MVKEELLHTESAKAFQEGKAVCTKAKNQIQAVNGTEKERREGTVEAGIRHHGPRMSC